MTSFDFPDINQRQHDFRAFCETEVIGPRLSSQFREIANAYAQDPFEQAWLQGLKFGWSKAHSDQNERANERMRLAFSALGQCSATAPPAPSLVRDAEMKPEFFSACFPGVYQTHMRIFGAVHASQDTPDNELALHIYRFYRTVMSVAWRSGYDAGQREAESQFNRRRHSEIPMSTAVEQEALHMEQTHIYECTLTLFNRVAPSEESQEHGAPDSDVQPGTRSRREKVAA